MALTLHGTVSDNTVALDRKTATPLIINGDMQIAQRGTSVTGITGVGYYTVDRFYFYESTSGTYTMSQDTDVPSGQGFSNSVKINTTTADSLTGTQSLRLRYGIEGQNLQHLKFGTSNAESITLSFWVKSNLTGDFVSRLLNMSSLRHITSVVTINSADTWEKKTITYASDTTGTFTNDNSAGLYLDIFFAAGSDLTSGAQPTTWQGNTTNSQATGITIDLAASTSNYINITGVQLEVGSFDANSIPPFQFEDRATSLARCQRYFQKLGGSAYTSIGTGILSNARTRVRSHVPYNTTMRSAPTLSIDGTLIVTERETFDTDISSIDGSVAGVNGAYINFAHSATGTALYGALITAKAGTTSFLEMDSEL